MKVSIRMEARHVPDGTRCRKVTGEKPYTLRRVLKIYGTAPTPTVINADPGYVFIVAVDATVNMIRETTYLAIDFENERDAIGFLTTQSTGALDGTTTDNGQIGGTR